MDLSIIKKIYNERAITNTELKNGKLNKLKCSCKGSSCDGSCKESCSEETLDEISKYDAVVTYYRDQLHLDPYKLRGVIGKQLRDKIKLSPAFHAWMKINKYESTDIISDDQLDETIGAGFNTKTMHKHLISKGWISTGPSGSHNNYSHPKSSNIISVPRHAKDINRITAMKLLKQSDDFNIAPKVPTLKCSTSALTLNILEKIKEVKKKSKKPAEEITFFGTGQEKKAGKPVATIDYGVN